MMELEISNIAGINNKRHKYRLDGASQDYSNLSDSGSVCINPVTVTKATAIWNVAHLHPRALKIKVNISAFKLIIFYCLTTFCNIKFFKYLLSVYFVKDYILHFY